MNKKNIIERKKAEIEKENLQRNSYLIESASIQSNNKMAWVLYFLKFNLILNKQEIYKT